VGERPFCWASAGTLKTIAAMATAVMRIMFSLHVFLVLGPATPMRSVQWENGKFVSSVPHDICAYVSKLKEGALTLVFLPAFAVAAVMAIVGLGLLRSELKFSP
jgi:hypothetical protein